MLCNSKCLEEQSADKAVHLSMNESRLSPQEPPSFKDKKTKNLLLPAIVSTYLSLVVP